MLTAASKLVRRSLPFHKPGWLAIIARTIGKKQALEELSAREMMVAVRKRTRNAAAVLKVDCGYFLVKRSVSASARGRKFDTWGHEDGTSLPRSRIETITIKSG